LKGNNLFYKIRVKSLIALQWSSKCYCLWWFYWFIWNFFLLHPYQTM